MAKNYENKEESILTAIKPGMNTWALAKASKYHWITVHKILDSLEQKGSVIKVVIGKNQLYFPAKIEKEICNIEGKYKVETLSTRLDNALIKVTAKNSSIILPKNTFEELIKKYSIKEMKEQLSEQKPFDTE